MSKARGKQPARVELFPNKGRTSGSPSHFSQGPARLSHKNSTLDFELRQVSGSASESLKQPGRSWIVWARQGPGQPRALCRLKPKCNFLQIRQTVGPSNTFALERSSCRVQDCRPNGFHDFISKTNSRVAPLRSKFRKQALKRLSQIWVRGNVLVMPFPTRH
jgi:hypothetical protein